MNLAPFLDALRLSSALHPGDSRLVKHMLSVEAAVWEETFWEVEGKGYDNHFYSVDDLRKGSWAFWFNQNEQAVSAAVGRIVNSYSPSDFVLTTMRLANSYYSYGPNSGERVDPGFHRGDSLHFRVPLSDTYSVSDPENRPDLASEIPALIQGNTIPEYPGWADFSKPLGMIPNPMDGTIAIPAAGDLGWTRFGHSDFLSKKLSAVWPWYVRLMAPDVELDNESVLPRGRE